MTVAIGVGALLGATVVGAMAMGRMLAVTLVAADCSCIWAACVRGFTGTGEAIGRMLAVLGASEAGVLKQDKKICLIHLT